MVVIGILINGAYRYDIEYLANAPLRSPDVLNFAIEEDESLVHLAIGQPSEEG